MESLAKDGDPIPLAISMLAKGQPHGVFNKPVRSYPGPLHPGQSYTFYIHVTNAAPRLSFAFKFANEQVNSNDWFMGTGVEGIALLDESDRAISSRDLTSQLHLWDAGTEGDEPASEGKQQTPRQTAASAEPKDLETTVHRVTGGPAVYNQVKVTIESAEPIVLRVSFRNVSDQTLQTTSFSPGIYFLHEEPNILFASGQPNLGNGLEALAEDGDPEEIYTHISTLMRGLPLASDEMEGMEVYELHKDMECALVFDLGGGKRTCLTSLERTLLHDLAFWSLYVVGPVWSLSDEELISMITNSIDMLQNMPLDELAVVADKVKWALEGPLHGNSPADNLFLTNEIMAWLAAYLGVAGAAEFLNMSEDDRAVLVNLGVEIVSEGTVGELTEWLKKGVDMLPKETAVAPISMGINTLRRSMCALATGPHYDSGLPVTKVGKVHAGIFNIPNGADASGPLVPGDTYEILVPAYSSCSTRLSLASMFIESNDWFVSTPPEGADLYRENGTFNLGVIPMGLYDAGTEEDEPVGQGAHQAPRQDDFNTGPADDDNTIRPVEMMDASDLVEVTVSICPR